MNSANFDSASIQRGLVTLGLIVVTVYLCFRAVISGSMFYIALVLALPVMIYFINNPRALLIAVFFTFSANLVVPGMPHNLTLAQVGIAGIVLLGVAQKIIEKESSKRKELSDRILVAMLLVVVMTMMIRGSGIRMLGSNQWGGTHYITILAGGAFYLVAPKFRFTPKNIKTLVILVLIGSFLPALAQILFLVTHGRFYHLYYLMGYSDIQYVADSMQVTSSPTFITRLTSFSGIAVALLPVAFVIRYRSTTGRLVQAAILASVFLLALLSGGRSAIMAVLATSLGMGYLVMKKTSRRKYVAVILAAGFVVFLGLISFADRLPLSAQRALSWIPYIHISSIASVDAQNSTLWRLDLWKYAWEEVPRYVLVGKGFCFDPAFMDSMSLRMDTGYGAFLVHNYHSGPLTLLLDLGVFGLIFWVAFIVRVLYENLRAIQWINAKGLDRRYYYYLLAAYAWTIVSFLFVYGDVSSILFFTLRGSLMRIIRYSIEEQDSAVAARETGTQTAPVREVVAATLQ